MHKAFFDHNLNYNLAKHLSALFPSIISGSAVVLNEATDLKVGNKLELENGEGCQVDGSRILQNSRPVECCVGLHLEMWTLVQ